MDNREHRQKNIRRFEELADRARLNCIYTYSTFHSRETAALAYETAPEREITIGGGPENGERFIVRFGDPEELSYEEAFPVLLILIEPRQMKFSETLTHRDFLGAVMNLGIERDMIGDILVRDNSAYIFVMEKISEIICSEIERVKHTAVKCSIIEELPEGLMPKFSEDHITVTSPRLDAVLSKIYHLSRTEAKSLFDMEKVTVNGRICRNPETMLKENSTVSVKGYGKIEYRGEEYQTKKGKTGLTVRRYV